MTYKFLEIRDAGTFIPVLAFTTNAADEEEAVRYLLRRAGFGYSGSDEWSIIYLVKLATGGAEYDPFDWDSSTRTMNVAHLWIEKNWNTIKSGDVVDVEFILGITKEPKISERLET